MANINKICDFPVVEGAWSATHKTTIGVLNRCFRAACGAVAAFSLATALAVAGPAIASEAQTNHLAPGQSPTALTVKNTTGEPVYLNLIVAQPPTTNPAQCTNLGQQITSINGSNLVFTSSVSGKTVSFDGPSGVTTKGAYLMDAGETITYTPQTFSCKGARGKAASCSPAFNGNFFFTKNVNGTTNGNNGCGGADTIYPNATNLAEFSLNFGVNGSVGSGCANADDTDVSIVNGVNATIKMVTTGDDWPASTSVAKNAALGSNTNLPGVFGWAATVCTGTTGFPNPSTSCPAPVNAPKPVNGACMAPNSLITGPDGTQYCAETSAAGTCNNQRTGYITGGNVAISYEGAIPAYIDRPAPGGIFNNAAAQNICPKVCSDAGGVWNGQWTNIVEPNVCGCGYSY